MSVYNQICELLAEFGFKKTKKGDMVRWETGCSFDVAGLRNDYVTLKHFQSVWKAYQK